MTKPKDITQRLRESREQKGDQAKQMQEQLTIIDAVIDEYDELILKMDGKIPPLIKPINVDIKAVETAYRSRVSHGCRSDLVWEKQVNDWQDNNGTNFETWKVVKDPAQRVTIGYYGGKYWRYPKNIEYGSNVIADITSASVGIMSVTSGGECPMAIFDTRGPQFTGFNTDGEPSGYKAVIKVGDYITDALENPYVYTTGNLPTVVGLGTTSWPGMRYALSGFCTSSDNKIYGDKNVGIFTHASIGDFVYDTDTTGFTTFSTGGVLPNGARITGFGTAVGIKTVVDSNGITTGVSVTYDFMTLNKTVTASIAATTGYTFNVGIVSTYTALFLSTSTSVGAAFSSFLVVRGPDNEDLEFDATKNPIDPVEIGMLDEQKVGRGHKLELINNKDPDIVAQWHEVQQDPEPGVGASYAEYWVGALSWPIYTRNTGGGGSGTEVYCAEGTQISYASTAGSIGYKTVPPAGSVPGDCGDYDQAIVDAESQMNSRIASDIPKVQHYIAGAAALREIRNDDETQAWSMLQGIGYINEDRKNLKLRADQLDDFDWAGVGVDNT